MKVERFEDLKVWQLSLLICEEVEKLIVAERFKSNNRLIDQLRGSSGSVMDNIAEGFERGGNKEFKTFLGYSKGSAGEVRSQLHRAVRLNYITEVEFEILRGKCEEVSRMLLGLMRYLKESELKGYKFSEPIEPYGEDTLNFDF